MTRPGKHSRPNEPPTHISEAVAKAMNDLNAPENLKQTPESHPEPGTAGKPAPEAAKTDPNPSKTPDSGPDSQPSDGAPVPPPRSPGRPRKTRIDSFNIDTDLELDERFQEFCKITGASESQALLSIIALYKYAARHRAIDGSLAGISPKLLAKRCHWRDTSESNAFTQALIQSGILTDKMSIADWLETQPHAKEYARKHRHYEKTRETTP